MVLGRIVRPANARVAGPTANGTGNVAVSKARVSAAEADTFALVEVAVLAAQIVDICVVGTGGKRGGRTYVGYWKEFQVRVKHPDAVAREKGGM